MASPEIQNQSAHGRMPPAAESASPLLTIAIPTYNRAKFLRELLESLEFQLHRQPRIELLISDNCSPDSTPDLVAEFMARGLVVRYVRNEQNIGPDANFLQCFELAEGEYFWLIGDDDILAPGAISKVMHYLETGRFDMLYVSQFPVKEPGMKPAPIKESHVVEYPDACSYARRIDVFFTFISANILRKKIAMANPPAAFADLVGTNLVQLSWTYSALNMTRCSLLFETAMLGARVDNTGGYSLFEVFGPKLQRITRSWVRDERVARQIENGLLRKFLPGFSYKTKRSKSPFSDKGSVTDLLTPVFRHNPRYWLFVLPVLTLPKLPATGWYAMVKIFNRLLRELKVG